MEKEKVYGVWAGRSAASIFGRAESWCKSNGRLLEFENRKDAEDYAKEANSHTTANVHYYGPTENRHAVGKTEGGPGRYL